MTHLYPIYLNLAQKSCLIIGGGKVAQRKIESLIEYEASIRVVSPVVLNEIAELADQGQISWKEGTFVPEDLKDVFMVFIATDDTGVNREITELCREKGILVNAVDDPPNCDFFVPSLLRRQSLAIAVSTEGKSPLFAARLRQQLEALIPEEYGQYVEMLGRAREQVKMSNLPIAARRELFTRLLDSDILDLVIQGEHQKAEERMNACISSWRA